MKQNTSQNGFTLVEMLVALSIFAFLSTGALLALNGALQNKKVVKGHLDQLAQIETARALIRADMAAMILRPARDGFGRTGPYVLQSGEGALLRFSRNGRANPGGLERRGDVQRISYVFDNGRLLRRVLPQANPAPQSKVIERVLMKGLEDVDLELFMNGQNVRGLSIPLKSSRVLPGAMKLSLSFNDGRSIDQYFEISSP